MKFNIFGMFSKKSDKQSGAPVVPAVQSEPVVPPVDNFTPTPAFNTVSSPMSNSAPVFDDVIPNPVVPPVQPAVTTVDPFDTMIKPAAEGSLQSAASVMPQPTIPPTGAVVDVVTQPTVSAENNSPSQPTPPSVPPAKF